MAKSSTVPTVEVGPWRGVDYTPEPNTSAKDLLYDAVNVYFPDCIAGSGAYARPGCSRPTSVSSGGNAGQGVHRHTALDGTNYNFLFVNGKVWRWSTDLTSAPTDVTPTNVTIGTGKFVYAVSLNDALVFNDGVNKPWVGSSLGSTPIVATIIEQQTPATILSIGSNDVRLANTAFTGTWSGTQATFAANAVGTAVGALGQIAIGTWGIILVEASNSTTLVFTAAFNAGAGYATEALAVAALPSRTAGRRYVGYVTVRADAGAVWIAGTDAFAGGTTGNQAQTTNYYAGEGPAYSVFGQPVIYYGSIFWIYQQVEATYARTTIGWSEPNEPAVGYQQTDYDNQWTLTQTSSDQLFALAPTNDALYYSRQLSWGAVAGAPGINFQGTATHDVVSGNIGCVSPASVKVFLNTVYFADMLGRPHRFRVGGSPEPLWHQARSQFDTYTTSPTTAVRQQVFAVVEPNLNLYLLGFTVVASPGISTFLAFDLMTGRYQGRWSVTSATMDVGGMVMDAVGTPALAFIQVNAAGTAHIWRLNRTYEAVWTDNSQTIVRNVTTPWLLYNGRDTRRVTEARALQNAAGVTASVTVNTASGLMAGAGAITEITAGSNVAELGRIVWSNNGPVARGVQVIVSPQNSAAQWRCWGIEFDVTDEALATVADY